MLGSRHEPDLMDDREVIAEFPSDGISLGALVAKIAEILSERDVEDLMIGYWEYGDVIVVTVPEGAKRRPRREGEPGPE